MAESITSGTASISSWGAVHSDLGLQSDNNQTVATPNNQVRSVACGGLCAEKHRCHTVSRCRNWAMLLEMRLESAILQQH